VQLLFQNINVFLMYAPKFSCSSKTYRLEVSALDSTTPTKPSLQVILNKEVIFESTGKWLFPLFDLEDYLGDHPLDMKLTEVRDKVIGKAAALLILRLGAGQVHGYLMSDLAITILEDSGTPYTYDERVARIDCQTEEILLEIDDLDLAYQLLCRRAKRC
jgi:hypothetical protein